MYKYIKKYYKLFLIAITFLTFESICDLLQPSIMSNIVDNGVANNDINYILKEGSKMLGITFIGAIFAIIRNIISTNVSQKFGYDLRNDLFIKINTYSFENIDKLNKASLITRITNDVTQVQQFIHGLMRVFIKAPILCIGSLIMAIKLNLKMSVVLIVIILSVLIIIIANLKIGYPFFKKVQKSLDNLNSKMREFLGGIRVIKAFNRSDYEINRFNEANEELYNVSTSAMRVMALFTPLITLILNIGIVIVLYLGSSGNFNIKVGELVAYINYMSRVLMALIMLSHIFRVFVRAKTSFERIEEVFEEKITMESGKKVIDDIESIEFENVYFSYNKTSRQSAIKDISFKIYKGQTLGIIGPTGSGKSSVINLIPRFYNIDSGNLKVNNISIDKLDIKNLREKISIVPQKNTLFSGSILDNIIWGKEDATIEEVIKCSKVANAHEFISSFTEGYNTKLGQGGVNVSGGQKQRISIARALIKDPDIIIFDDATSALDVTTEADIRKKLKEYLGNLTTIIIAQRISSVIDCDNILVLEEGEIVGSGTHNELIQSCEVYKDIFKSQIDRGLS